MTRPNALLAMLLLLVWPFAANAQNATSHLEKAMSHVQLDKNITSPAQYLGYPLGEWHIRHDQINGYLTQLASASPKVSLDSAGRSIEMRDQLTAVITSENNQANLAQIIQTRAQVKTAKQVPNSPLVIWLAYSIHGDEASGAHAAIAFSYYLAASNEPWVRNLLDKAVVLITPSQNPDGFDRFSTWANNHKGLTPVLDDNHREHFQDWPTGRGNHYLADLNRDWLFLRHKASQGRVAFFHKWQPHYVGDFHEMWPSQSYFFQPGVAERVYPLTPKANQELTEKLANFHRKALDEAKQVYFSGQLFDDFFYGKGSTYPDINGSVGVLFEQASARGQAQQSDNGVVTLQQGIDNHFATSISSVQGALALKDELIEYQHQFYSEKNKQAQPRMKGMLVRAANDRARRDELANLLSQHQIEFHYLTKSLHHSGIEYRPQDSIFISENQAQASLLAAMFDKRTEFVDPTFYDISSWDLQSAFALDMATNITPDVDLLTRAPMAYHLFPHTQNTPPWPKQTVALLIDWQQANAPALVNQLLTQKIQVKYAIKPFSVALPHIGDTVTRQFVAGSLQIPIKQAGKTEAEVVNALWQAVKDWQVDVINVVSATSISGMDLGSDDFKTIKPVKPMIISGFGTDPFEVGELWYYFDNTLKMPVSLVNAEQISRVDLTRYSHIFMAEGHYRSLTESGVKKLNSFVEQGGVIVAQKGALSWLSRRNIAEQGVQSARFYQRLFNADGLSFDKQADFAAKQHIGGAIVRLKLDPTHPLSFGLKPDLTVMKNKPLAMESAAVPFTIAGHYQDKLLVSGYMAKEYQRAFANQPAMLAERHGKGAVVGFTDNLMFRNIWLGSQKAYANALYFMPQG